MREAYRAAPAPLTATSPLPVPSRLRPYRRPGVEQVGKPVGARVGLGAAADGIGRLAGRSDYDSCCWTIRGRGFPCSIPLRPRRSSASIESFRRCFSTRSPTRRSAMPTGKQPRFHRSVREGRG